MRGLYQFSRRQKRSLTRAAPENGFCRPQERKIDHITAKTGDWFHFSQRDSRVIAITTTLKDPGGCAMDLLDYKIFVHLAQTLHFGRTAKTLGMSASALTRRVQAMEEELENRLLVREHRQIALTSAGSRFLSFARAQLQAWETLQNELRDETAAPTGTLRISCTVTAAHTVLPRLLAQFRVLYPGVTIKLTTQDATRSLTQLEAGEVDLAVIPTDPEAPHDLKSTVLGETELRFIAPLELNDWKTSLSLCPPDLTGVPLVAPLSGLERKRLDEWLKQRQQEPHIVAEVRGNEGMIAMVSLGAGIALVPQLVLETSPLFKKVQILAELEPPAGYQISLCTRGHNLERRVIQLFWNLAEGGL